MIRFALAGAALLASAPALACGGFFCQNTPVDQAAERILFSIDDETGKIEMHVQITYEGSAPDFAWVLPVPNIPDLQVTTDDVLTRLANATFPQFQTMQEVEGTCRQDDTGVQRGGAGGGFNGGPPSAEDGADGDLGGGVEVVGSGAVGPYDFEILSAGDADELEAYLLRNDYVLPDDFDEALAPYVAGGQFFVALRLQNGKTAGDLQPLALTYEGSEPIIPLELTAIAATPDMRLVPFVLGSARAVPENYLHVQVNPFAVNWLQQGANYDDVVSAAADVAGGQGFATDFVGPTDALDGLLWTEGQYRPGQLRSLGDSVDAQTLVDTMRFTAGYPLSAGTLPYLKAALPIDPSVWEDLGISDLNFYSCPSCWGASVPDGDAVALADALEQEWEPAMQHAQGLIDRAPVLTRLVSSMDAAEMTVDPRFVLNPDMADVDNVRTATLTTVCGDEDFSWWEAPRRLDLADGRSLWLPPEAGLDPFGFDWDGYVGEAGIPAELVEGTGRSGQPTPIQDFREDIADELMQRQPGAGGVPDVPGYEPPDGVPGVDSEPVRGGCGCNTGGTSGVWILGLGLLAVGRRRRQA